MHNRQCFTSHMGIWCIEPYWMAQAVQAIKAGLWKPLPKAAAAEPKAQKKNDLPKTVVDGDGDLLFSVTRDGIAIIPMTGPMMKGKSKMGGVSTLAVQRALKLGLADPNVKAFVPVVDSPGGHVAGTQQLAEAFALANDRKPVVVQVQDQSASAAVWVTAFASQIFANETAEIGSVGTVAVVDDFSGMFQQKGISVHVISTGEFKGAFVEGAPIEKKQLEDLERRVNALNGHFLRAVSNGRRLPMESVEKIADGRVHIAADAVELGLIDGVQSLETTLAQVARMANSTPRRDRAAASIRIAEL